VELPWAQPGWRARAEAWIGQQLGPLGREAAGDVAEVKLRPWSAVLRAPTSGGDVYFKANLPALANEPELTRLLHRIDPGHVLPVLAEEPDEGWMLQADGGPTMRSRLDGGDDLGRWERMLGCYAELQVRASAHVEELLAATDAASDLAIAKMHLTKFADVSEQSMLATPLRFAGMPADRYWEFEDSQVNLGALQVQPHDLARMLLVEFATVYGNDWLGRPPRHRR